MPEVDKGLKPAGEAAKFHIHTFKLNPKENADFLTEVKASGLSKTGYIKARLFGHPVKDRSQLQLVVELHSVGRKLEHLMSRTLPAETEGESRAAIAEIRDLLTRVASELA